MSKPLFAPNISNLNRPSGDAGAYQGSVQDPSAPPMMLQYWQTALRWKFVIISILAIALAAGILATLLATPQFTAQTQIEITRDQKNPTQVQGVESAQSAQEAEFYQTQYTLLESNSLAERVARQLNLGNSEEFYSAHSIEFAPGQADARARVRSAAGILLSHVDIMPINRSRLVNIQYTSASPELSARIANAWAENFIQASMDRRFAATQDARSFLEKRLQEYTAKLEDAERKSEGFAADRGIIVLSSASDASGNSSIQKTLVASDLEAMSSELVRATAARIQAQAAVTDATSTAQVQNPVIGALRQQRAQAAAEYSQMLVQFGPEYPAALALKERTATIDAAIASEVQRISRSVRNEYAEAVRREGTLRESVEKLKGQVQQQSRDAIQYNIHRRDADATRQLYDTLLQRTKEMSVASVAANNIAVVDRAETPGGPTSPSLMTNLLIALLLGSSLALLAVIGLEQIDEGLREPADVRRLLELPLLGTVLDQGDEDPLDLLADPKSNISEAYLSVRTNLAFTTDHGVPKSLVVTSTSPAEGKSTSSFSLALVLARTGKRTLLIDADMRSPSVHQFAGIKNESGLSNLLAGEDNWQEMVKNSTLVEKLDFLSAGPTPPSAAELLSSDRMMFLIQELSKNYDHIVIDAPPLLGLADVPLLSRAVEGCIFVVASGQVAVRGLRTSLSRLQQAHARIFGVILTRLPKPNALSGYGYGYGYGYGHRYGQDADGDVAAKV